MKFKPQELPAGFQRRTMDGIHEWFLEVKGLRPKDRALSIKYRRLGHNFRGCLLYTSDAADE